MSYFFGRKQETEPEPVSTVADHRTGEFEPAPWMVRDQSPDSAAVQELEPAKQKKEESQPLAVGCCGRFCAELRHPAFSPKEVTGQVIHGPQTFGPAGWSILLLKTVFMGWSVSILVMDLLETEYETFYFVYLTNATLLLSAIYLSMSWYHTVVSTTLPGNERTRVSLIQKVTWGFYAVAAPSQIVVTIGYWGMDWDGDLQAVMDYRNLSVHGGIMLVLLMEGLMVNRVPLRLRHMGLLMLYLTGYLIWTVVHAFVGIGDPTSEDDDAIYDVLKWKDDPANTGMLAAFFLLVLGPLSFMAVYWLSLPCGCQCTNRRYLKGFFGTEDDATVASFVEMNSINGP